MLRRQLGEQQIVILDQVGDDLWVGGRTVVGVRGSVSLD
jgi:hypothetical protein